MEYNRNGKDIEQSKRFVQRCKSKEFLKNKKQVERNAIKCRGFEL